jgi:hypothetical protein
MTMQSGGMMMRLGRADDNEECRGGACMIGTTTRPEKPRFERTVGPCAHLNLAGLNGQVRPVSPTSQTGVVMLHKRQFGLHH